MQLLESSISKKLLAAESRYHDIHCRLRRIQDDRFSRFGATYIDHHNELELLRMREQEIKILSRLIELDHYLHSRKSRQILDTNLERAISI